MRSTGATAAGQRLRPRAALCAARADGVVTIYALFGEHSATGDAAQGSGFVVSDDGYVLTNSHVITTAGEGDEGDEVEAADSVFVEFRDGERTPAKVVGWDLFDDVGVLKVEPGAHALAPVPLGDSAAVTVGEPVAAIGSPFGEQTSLAVGVVSATRPLDRRADLRVPDHRRDPDDAPINRGNSGGPLFDARGRVIGINAQIRSDSGHGRGRRLRGSDQLGAALARAARQHRQGVLRVRRHLDRRPDARGGAQDGGRRYAGARS